MQIDQVEEQPVTMMCVCETLQVLAAGCRAWNMVGISHNVTMSRGASQRQGAGHHWGEPLMDTENSLLLHAVVSPSAWSC